MRVEDGNLSRFFWGSSDLIDDVLFQEFKADLLASSGFEGETVSFAFYFSFLGSVAVILGPAEANSTM